MEDDVLNNILNLLQNDGNAKNNVSTNKNTGHNLNDDLQGMLLKMLLSGGLNNMFAPKQTEPAPASTTPPTPRTINLENYKRLDWTTMASSTTSTVIEYTVLAIKCSEILSSIWVWIKRRNGRTPNSFW